MFNSAAKLNRAASGATVLAKPKPVSTSVQSVNSVADKPMHHSLSANSFSPSTKVDPDKNFHDLVNQKAKALVPAPLQKQSNELENEQQQTSEISPENKIEIEIENLNMEIKGLDQLIKAWKKDLDYAKQLHLREEIKSINAKIKKAKEKEISLMNKRSIIKSTSEITKREKVLEKLNIDSAKAVKMKKLATARTLNFKIKAAETDLAVLKNIKAQVLKDIAKASITSAPKAIEKKASPTKQSFKSKTETPSKDQTDSVTLATKFVLLDKSCCDLNRELSLAKKYLSVEKIPYCQELIVRAQKQLKQIDEFKITHKKLELNNINYLNILILKRRKDIALFKEMIQAVIKNKEQTLKIEITALKRKLERTTNAINIQAKHSEHVDLEEIDRQMELTDSLRTTILSKMKEIGEIQQIKIQTKYSTDTESLPILTNELEAEIIRSSERNRKVKEKFCCSLDDLTTKTKLKKITEIEEEKYDEKETKTIEQQAINLEITKLKAELDQVMNSIEAHYKTLENTDVNKDNLENENETIASLLELAEFLDTEISMKLEDTHYHPL